MDNKGNAEINPNQEGIPVEKRIQSIDEYQIYLSRIRKEIADEFENRVSQQIEFFPVEKGSIFASRREIYELLLNGYLEFKDDRIIARYDPMHYQGSFVDFVNLSEFNRIVRPNIRLSRIKRVDFQEQLESFHRLQQMGGAYFIRLRTPFITSNEEPQPMLWLLNRIPMLGRGQSSLHIGFAGLLNLDIMALRKSKFGILMDIDPRIIEVYQMIDQILVDTTDRRVFVEKLTEGLKHVEFDFYKEKGGDVLRRQIHEIENQLTFREGWLSSDDSFAYIRNMFREGRVKYFRSSLYNVEMFKRIGQWIKQNGIVTDTIYISNIYEWEAEDKDNFGKSLSYVTNRQAFLIESKHIMSPTIRLAYKDQRVIDAAMFGIDNDFAIEKASASPAQVAIEADRVMVIPHERDMIKVNLKAVVARDYPQLANFNFEAIPGEHESQVAIKIERQNGETLFAADVEIAKNGISDFHLITWLLNGLGIAPKDLYRLLFLSIKGIRRDFERFRTVDRGGRFESFQEFIEAFGGHLRKEKTDVSGTRTTYFVSDDLSPAFWDALRSNVPSRVLVHGAHAGSQASRAMITPEARNAMQQTLETVALDYPRLAKFHFGIELDPLEANRFSIEIKNNDDKILLRVYVRVDRNGISDYELDPKIDRKELPLSSTDTDRILFLAIDAVLKSFKGFKTTVRGLGGWASFKRFFDAFGGELRSQFIGFVSGVSDAMPPIVAEPLTETFWNNLRNNIRVDRASVSGTTRGGIDLTSDKVLTAQNNGQGIKFHMDPAQLAQFENAPGFTPVIINMEPLTDLRGFLDPDLGHGSAF